MNAEVKIPVIGESVTEATIGQWVKQDGAYVMADETICMVESEKAAMEVAAPVAGVLKIAAPQGAALPIGAVIATININTEEKTAPGAGEAVSNAQPPRPEPREKVFITPVAKQILQEKGVSPENVPGTGEAGRITKTDALKAVSVSPPADGSSSPENIPSQDSRESYPPKPAAQPQTPVADAPPSLRREERHERMSTLRRTIARRLVEAKNTAAMLTTINEVDMSAIQKLREELKDEFFNKYGVKPGMVSLFGKAVCIALKDMPVINARVEGEDIVYHDFVDLSIAVSTPRGLVVPVVRNADQMSVATMEKHIQTLAVKAREGKLTLEEMSGGTFTLTNGGVFGSLISTPIINAPQSAVLGMHSVQDRPVALNGQVTIRPMMYISLSYDHRIIDGRESVLFLVHVKALLENPNRMLLEL